MIGRRLSFLLCFIVLFVVFQPGTAYSQYCCEICKKGKACGDNCVSRSYTCNKPRGCACNAYETQETLVSNKVYKRPAKVIDGNTLEIDGRIVRLEGIDAPELNQKCYVDGQEWDCGKDSKTVLEEMVKGRAVSCKDEGNDHHGEMRGTCSAGGQFHLNENMVLLGWAVAYRKYSEDYIDEEEQAKKEKMGIYGYLEE